MKWLHVNRLLNLTNSLIWVQLLLRKQVIFYSLLHKYDEPVRRHSARIVLSTLATSWFAIIKIHILTFKVVQNILSCFTFFYCDKDQSEKQLEEGAVCLTLQLPVHHDRSSAQELTAEPGGRYWRSYQWVLLTGLLFMAHSVFFLILPVTACPGVEYPIMVALAPHSASPLPKHRLPHTGWLWTTNYRALLSIRLSSSKSRSWRGRSGDGGNR